MTVPWNRFGNDSLVDQLERELPQSTIYLLIISILAAVAWITYITYYNSRVIGLIVTLVLNKFIKQAHVKFGSFSISLLSGKLMFRDVHYVTEDYSLRVQLGYVIFRWWRPMPDSSNRHADTRLTVYLDSVELHVYNQSSEYAKLERLFGLDEFMIPGSRKDEDNKSDSKGEETALTGKAKQQTPAKDPYQWRELIPVVKFEISSGKMVFGNHLLPNTLSINFGDAHIMYTTKPASTPFDLFMYIVKCKADHVKVMLVPSPKYTGAVIDEPPRFMGDGFVVFQSSAVDIYYYQDQPGLVPYEPEQVQLANGDVIARRTWPCWGMDIKCGKGTDLSYGPWADRQREYIWNFFYPPSYEPLEPTDMPNPGQLRIMKSFDFKLSIQQEGTFDVLFTKDRETQALHMTYGAGSYLEFSVPMVTEEAGFVSKVNGQLMHLDCTTSLAYRPFVETETFEFDVEAHYPRYWNEHQDWKMHLTMCKAAGSLIYEHKIFLVDLVDDWSTKTRPDIFSFCPYTWRVGLILRDFELGVVANEWNWMDCLGPTFENTQIAACGELFDVKFDLPFIDYLPEYVPIEFHFKIETADLRFYLPETNTMRHSLLSIAENMRVVDRDGVKMDTPFAGLFSHRWRKRTLKEDGWVDMWTTPSAVINFKYTFHPQPPTGEDCYMYATSPITTPDAEEQLLIPLRVEASASRKSRSSKPVVDFDPGILAPDLIEIDVELGPSVVCVYGCLIMSLYNMKEDYLGEDQKFTDMSSNTGDDGSSFANILSHDAVAAAAGNFDMRQYRPLAVKVNAVINDIQAHLIKNVNEGDPPVPCARIERVAFELDKKYEGTELQVLMSPAYLTITDNFKIQKDDKTFELRPEPHRHVNEGHVALSGLQVRGHALFSHRGLPLGTETLEYGWLVEVIVGDITGRLTSSHLQNIVEILQTTIFLVQDSENVVQHPLPYHFCQHGVPAPECTQTPSFLSVCPSSEDIKYRLTRVSVDCVDLYLAEAGTALNVQVYPVRLSTCNLHGKHNEAGITAIIPNIKLRQFVLSIPINQPYDSQADCWLEAGGVCLGPISVDAALALPKPEYRDLQDEFLKWHDVATKRLWFMWPEGSCHDDVSLDGKCGCLGNCNLFGGNRNGPRFFLPSEDDFTNSYSTAVYHICVDEDNLGYGQSLLHENKLIFSRIPGPLFLSTPTRQFLLDQASNQAINSTNIPSDVIDDFDMRSPDDIRDGGITSASNAPNQNRETRLYSESIASSEHTLTSLTGTKIMNEDLMDFHKSASAPGVKRPEVLQLKADVHAPATAVSVNSGSSECLPTDSMPGPYDLDITPSEAAARQSGNSMAGSLPDMVDFKSLPTRKASKGHSRKSSYEPPKTGAANQENGGAGKSGNVLASYSSPVVMRDNHLTTHSHQGSQQSFWSGSSLTSPVFRRLSQREGSLVSMESSATFVSAREELSDEVSSLGACSRNSSFRENPRRTAGYPGSSLNSSFREEDGEDVERNDDTLTESMSNPLWFAVDRDNTMTSSIDHQTAMRDMAQMEEGSDKKRGSRLEDIGRRSSSISGRRSSSVSGSVSSFVSAVSSQHSDSRPDVHVSIESDLSDHAGLFDHSNATINRDESFHKPVELHDIPSAGDYVDLHGQMNQPITKSPLLMSCYTAHMTKLHCSHWSAPPPHYHGNGWDVTDEKSQTPPARRPYQRQSSLTHDPGQSLSWIPQFAYVKEGFTPSLMTNKNEIFMKAPPNLSSPKTSDWRNNRFFADNDHTKDRRSILSMRDDVESSVELQDDVSKTTATINLKGSVDVMVSPLMLEALQRYVESVTPVLGSLHPSAILDSLHFRCINSIKDNNQLKHDPPDLDTSNVDKNGENKCGKRSSVESEIEKDRECKTSRIQVNFSLSRINLCILQASLVEEMVPFGGLDRVQELTCVSVLACCLDDLHAQFLLSNQSHKALEPSASQAPQPGVEVYVGNTKQPTREPIKRQDTEEAKAETQLEDMVGKLHIGRIHAQLRRLKKNSNFSDNVFLTAIPEYRSKVLFTFKHQDQLDQLDSAPPPPASEPSSSQNSPEDEGLEDIAGFIMVEAGLENITLKAARRSGYEDTKPEEEEVGKEEEEEQEVKDMTAKRGDESENEEDQQEATVTVEIDEDVDKLSVRSQAGSLSSDSSSASEVSYASRISLEQEKQKANESKTSKSSAGSKKVAPEIHLEGMAGGHNHSTSTGKTKPEVKGDASSLVLEFKKAWFNFAAPPPSKKKKLQFTRHDWNLVSTATPAINAWLNPCHRAIVSAHNLVTKLEHRITTVMACLMTEALDYQKLHNLTTSRYNKLSPMAVTLQEDPSCQLLTVLRRYVRFIGVTSIEESVSADSVPQLLTIQKGILALTRQWKNILHMPVETAFKSKKKGPAFVTFSLPEDTKDHSREDVRFPNDEVDDENISLLKAEGGSIKKSASQHSIVQSGRRSHTTSVGNVADASMAADNAVVMDSNVEDIRLPFTKSANGKPKLKGVASAAALGAFESPFKKHASSHRSMSFAMAPETMSKKDLTRHESHTSFHSLTQSMSDLLDGGGPGSVPGTPLKQSLTRHLSELEKQKKKREDENLYFWMQRQLDYQPNFGYYQPTTASEPTTAQQAAAGLGGPSATSRTGASDISMEDIQNLQRLATVPTSGFSIADAQVLFKPLLKSMGLKLGEVKTSALMKKLGCHLSIKVHMSSLRIDIVDSENKSKRHKGRSKGKRPTPKFYINTNLDTPAFYCDTFEVLVAMKDIVNFENEDKDKTTPNEDAKFAFDSLIAKPTTTKVNIALNIMSINQHVNMSLLRLVHQFVTMIENVNDTRAELKGLTSTDAFRGHRKQDSKGSSTDTGADLESLGQPEFPNLSRHRPPSDSSDKRSAYYDLSPGSISVENAAVSQHSSLSRKLTPLPKSRPDKLPLPIPGASQPKKLFARPNMYELLSSKSTPEVNNEAEFPAAEFENRPPVVIELGGPASNDMSSPVLAEKTIIEEIKGNTPQCWRNLYALLNLYSTVPETRTFNKPTGLSRLSVIDEEPERTSQSHLNADAASRVRRMQPSDVDQVERQPLLEPHTPITPSSVPSSLFTRPYPQATVFTQSVLMGERVPLVVFGMMCVRRVRMSAMLSGLKLEADLNNVNASATHREKIKGVTKRKSEETSVTANVGHTMIALLEGVAPNMQTVVTVKVAQSQALVSAVMRRMRHHSSGLLTVGCIHLDIPQHPGVLHGMVSRSSKRLSSTLQEFIRQPTKARSMDINEGAGTPNAQTSKHSDVNDAHRVNSDTSQGNKSMKKEDEEEDEAHRPFIINFKAVLKGLTVGASLLPSLRAQYQIGQVMSSGVTGKKASFNVDLPSHSLSFSSKVSTPTNLPAFASIDLPPIHMLAQYHLQHEVPPANHMYGSAAAMDTGPRDEGLGDGLEYRSGNYLHALAEVGLFEHNLTTDLLNHLVFVQKVFMKEINEVVQKISGVDQPVSIWGEDTQQPPVRPLLYSLRFRLKGIQITATTPTSSAVRLETGLIDLYMSNRVQPVRLDPNSPLWRDRLKVFVKLQLELNLALGTLLKNPIFPEADAEFQQLATFATRINMRNALQDEMIPGTARDQEALMISLKRPVVSVMPSAFDKAVLVWLNYKNAYEYWTEQRLAQIQDYQTPVHQQPQPTIPQDRVPDAVLTRVQAASSSQALGTLFLQLTVEDLGICLPLGITSQSLGGGGRLLDDTGTPALVLTLESTQISACSCGSLVSKGRFNGFCLRFASDFEVSWDDWKPDRKLDIVMNAMVVPCGTYEVCSRTKGTSSTDPLSNAKWILNVKWEMEGMDIHLDTNIGKRLSALGDTLTTLGVGDAPNQDDETYNRGPIAEEEEEEEEELEAAGYDLTSEHAHARKFGTIPEGLPDFLFDPNLDAKTRARMIEQEMNEQAKTVEDLKQLGASQSTIESEERKLLEFEKVVFQDFRQDLLKKLKKQGARTAVLKDKLGLGYKPAHIRSRSTGGAPGAVRTGNADSRRLTSCSEDSTGALFDIISESDSDSSDSGNHQRALSVDVSSLGKEHGTGHVTFDSTGPSTASTPKLLKSRRPGPQDTGLSWSDESDTNSSGEEEQPPKFLSGDKVTRLSSPTGTLTRQSAVPVAAEPMVDFEVDVKVDISRGRCVVHPKEPKAEEEETKSSSKKPMAGASPRSERKKAARKLEATQDHTTVFTLPGVDIKVHYGSRMVPIAERDSPSSSLKRNVQPPTSESGKDSGGLVKKGNLYAWISLKQLSEEMMISPSLLDFLEQALEPIPMAQLLQSKPATSPEAPTTPTPTDLDASSASLVASTAAYTSFPVDVVVYISVQPSLIRFTCLPVSRVQCLLRFPSFDVVFSTKKADMISNQPGSEDPLNVPKRCSDGLKRMPSHPSQSTLLSRSASTAATTGAGRARNLSGIQADPSSGGLSVTACMSDFSLYVFHPYGGSGRVESAYNKKPGSLNESLGSPGSEVGRKDSLSLKVEFVKVNISRTRKGLLHSEKHRNQDAKAANIVRFSALCDVGSAAFNYDMRRLSEILSLPKAWYRRSLARRLFLGEETAFMEGNESGDEDLSFSTHANPPDSLPLPSHHRPHQDATQKSDDKTGTGSIDRKSTDDKYRKYKTPNVLSPQSPRLLSPVGRSREAPAGTAGAPSSLIPSSPRRFLPAPVPPGPAVHSVHSDTHMSLPQNFDTFARLQQQSSSSTASGRAFSEWETLVLFVVNLSRLDVNVNMSNVMGNTVWTTRDLQSQGQLSIDSSGYRNMHITAGLNGSKLEAKGGIVGGYIELQELNSLLSIKEDPGRQPDHRVGLELVAIEIKLDYMGSSVLMNRFSGLVVQMYDEWTVDTAGAEDKQPLATKRPAQIFVHGALAWDKLHLMISRSTTPDLLKMVNKLEEFFTQQLNSGKRALSAMGPLPIGGRNRARKTNETEQSSWISEIRHHRHWQRVLERIAGCKFTNLTFVLPQQGTILGGSMNLHGNNITLACFHGINFRSKSWALFTMQEPMISFSTESQDLVDDDGAKCTHIIQHFQFQLGNNMIARNQKRPMAYICKLSRGHYMPPPFTNVNDWFKYAFSTNEIKELDNFPIMTRVAANGSNTGGATAASSPTATTPEDSESRRKKGKKGEHNHDTEIIFQLPLCQMHLNTVHLQGATEPEDGDPQPVVHCSFVTEFEDHIFVAMDAEVLLFLHDLVMSYVKEKDKGVEKMLATAAELEKKDIANPTTVLKLDYRHFQCNTWVLEPTVRLISWAGNRIEPVGVDYILQKLGFQHARLTVPKWMQRGCMDPLDKLLSIIIDRLIVFLKEKEEEEDEVEGAEKDIAQKSPLR